MLTGCAAPGASAPDGPDEPSEAAVAAAAVALDARRAALDAFAVGGALGYWTDDENVTARLDWREAGGTTEIFLAGPLGLGALTLVDGPGGATLARSGAPPVSGPSADALLQGVLGLEAPIPLAAARDWLRGLPGPGATDVRRDAAGRLETLLWSDGAGARWFARIRRWTEVDGASGTGAADGNGFELPALVTARSGDRRLRLALSDWRLGAPGAPAATGPDGPGAGRAARRATGRATGRAGDGPGDGPGDGDGGAPGTGGRLAIPGR